MEKRKSDIVVQQLDEALKVIDKIIESNFVQAEASKIFRAHREGLLTNLQAMDKLINLYSLNQEEYKQLCSFEQIAHAMNNAEHLVTWSFPLTPEKDTD